METRESSGQCAIHPKINISLAEVKKVSVIIPVYNAASILVGSIKSILKQTYPNIELIIIDDSSTDESFAIAKSFEGDAVKVLQQKNAGAAVARNTGLAVATGTYIQFLDVDDYLTVDKIEKQMAELAGRINVIAVCNYASFINDDEIEGLKADDQSSFIYSSDIPSDFLINLLGANGFSSNFIQTNCWLVPRAIIDKSGPWRNYKCPDDDGEFFSRVILASKGIVYVPNILNFYRRQNSIDKLSSNLNNKYVQNTLLTIDLKYQYLVAKHNSLNLNKAFARQYLDFAVYNYPLNKLFSNIALKRYSKFKQHVDLPLLGGKWIEMAKWIFGWRIIRLFKHYFL